MPVMLPPDVVARPYQEEAFEKIKDAFESGKQGALVGLPTGTGKTFVYAMFVKYVLDLLKAQKRKGKVLIFVPHDFLYDQGKEDLSLLIPNPDIGLVGFGEDDWNHSILFGSVQAFAVSEERREKLKRSGIVAVVSDEAHIAFTAGYLEVLRSIPDVFRVGFTATIKRHDGREIQKIFGNPVYYRSLPEMIAAGWLSELKSILVRTMLDFTPAKKDDDYDETKLELICNCADMNEVAVKEYKKHRCQERMTLVFCSGKKHARDLAALFNEHGITAEAFVDDLTKAESKAMLDRFATGQTKVLTNVRRAEVGLNIPGINCIIVAAPTLSETKTLQRLGRGTRTCPGKKDCLVIDLTDTTETHDLNPTIHLCDVLELPELDPDRSIRQQLQDKIEEELKKPKKQQSDDDLDEAFGDIFSKDILRFKKDLAVATKWDKDEYGNLFTHVKDPSDRMYEVIIQPNGYNNYETYVFTEKGKTWKYGDNLSMDAAERQAKKAMSHLKEGNIHLIDPEAKWRKKPVSDVTLQRLQDSHCPKNRYWKTMSQEEGYAVLQQWYKELGSAKSKQQPKRRRRA